MIEQEGPETIAAFIAEPVMGAGGVLIPPKTYFEKVQAVLAKHDIAFIADEVICGFAPHRQLVGFADLRHRRPHRHHGQGHHLGLRADGRAHRVGAGLPGAGGGERQAGRVRHGFTYSGHPLACAVALKTIEIYERIKIVEHVQRMAPIFQLRLKALADHPLVGEARASA